MSSLWRTQRPRFPFYASDGRGRDYYIKFDNGGYWGEQFKLRKVPDYERTRYSNFHTLFHQAAPFKYWGNGRGRENYILMTNGLFHDQKPLCAYKLTDFLRNETAGKNSKRKIFLSVSEKKYNDKLRNFEKKLIKRLYTEPLNLLKKSKTNLKELNLELQNTVPDMRFNTISNWKNEDSKVYDEEKKYKFNNTCGNFYRKKFDKKKFELKLDNENETKSRNIKKVLDYDRMQLTSNIKDRKKFKIVGFNDDKKCNLKMKAAFAFRPRTKEIRFNTQC